VACRSTGIRQKWRFAAGTPVPRYTMIYPDGHARDQPQHP
jgi:hypothetical protein